MLALLPALALQSSLDAILDSPKLQGATVCATVCKTDGTVVYSRNPDRHFMPASNQKLLTASFALHTLGPAYAPKTRIWNYPDRIIVDAPGDPSMTYAQLKEAGTKLARTERVPVFVRQAYYVEVPPTWEYDDLANRYAPRITALTLDRGAFQLWAENGELKPEPEGFGVRIIRFGYGPRLISFDPMRNVLVVRGELPKERTLLDTFSIPEPDAAAASLLGGPRIHAWFVPETEPTLTLTGKTVGELVADCLPPSDNFIAESLFLMAAKTKGIPQTNPYPIAAMHMKNFLTTTVGIEKDDVRVVDGSGMSRHNLVTSRALVAILLWADKQPFSELWHNSLARPGAVGTLQNRLKDLPFHGKTGTLDMVSSLSGYVKTASGETLVASVALNNYLCTPAEARQVLDAFMKNLAEAQTNGTVLVSGEKSGGPLSEPRNSSPHGNRLPGPLLDRSLPPDGAHRRNEPAYAAASRAKRVAVRAG